VLELEVRERPPSTQRNIDGGPPGGPGVGDVYGRAVGGGVLAVGPTTSTTEVEDIDGGALRGAGGRSGSGHHRS
jgi:hypothetical protein